MKNMFMLPGSQEQPPLPLFTKRKRKSRKSKSHPSPPTPGKFEGEFLLPAPDIKRAKKKEKLRRYKVVVVAAKHCEHVVPPKASQQATFDTIEAYGLFNDGGCRRLEPKLAPSSRMSDFHEKYFLEDLKNENVPERTSDGGIVGSDTRYQGPVESGGPTTPTTSPLQSARNNDEKSNGLHRENCFKGLWKYCQLVTGATLVATNELLTGKATLAVNYMGGKSLATPDSVHGRAYVNDTALAIFQLRRKFQRIAVIDLSASHSQALQDAFYYSNHVFTVSVHRYEKKSLHFNTGRRKDKGDGNGRHCNLNINMSPNANDSNLLTVVKEFSNGLVNIYKPDCVIITVGTNGLNGGVSKLKYTPAGIAASVDWILKVLDVPTLLLGGDDECRDIKECGKHARLWTLLVDTAINATKGVISTLPNDIPDDNNSSWELMGPSFELRERDDVNHCVNQDENLNTEQMNIKINGIKRRFYKLEREQNSILQKIPSSTGSSGSSDSSGSGNSGNSSSSSSSSSNGGPNGGNNSTDEIVAEKK
jgi:acetoin utilization deacetylase AcuC-like enzyme